jgi:hypothetical protein
VGFQEVKEFCKFVFKLDVAKATISESHILKNIRAGEKGNGKRG